MVGKPDRGGLDGPIGPASSQDEGNEQSNDNDDFKHAGQARNRKVSFRGFVGDFAL